MRKMLFVFVVLGYAVFSGCFSHPKYLESKYFLQRKVAVIENATNILVSISGLCGHSSLGVDQPEKLLYGDVLDIEFPLRFGASGTIDEIICVPNHINRIKVAGDLIWERIALTKPCNVTNNEFEKTAIK